MIIYNNGATGTLKPPILNGIDEINTNDSIAINAPNVLTFNAVDANINAGSINYITSGLSIQSVNLDQGTGDYVLTVQGTYSISVNFLMVISAETLNINSSFPIIFNNAIVIGSLTTAEILSLTPQEGCQIYNITLQQMFFYQVSPITGTVLGWYNSTGTIKL